jgi:hypothetical protein
MDLIQKFKSIAAGKESHVRPPYMEVNSPYPIFGVFEEKWPHYRIITLMLLVPNAKGVGFYEMGPYAKVFSSEDIAELEAEPGKFKLILR